VRRTEPLGVKRGRAVFYPGEWTPPGPWKDLMGSRKLAPEQIPARSR